MKTTLITLLATAILGYCQESATQETGTPAAETATTAATLPAVRTITDLKGRSMEGTTLSQEDFPDGRIADASAGRFVRSAAIRLLLPNPGAVGKSREQEIVERREIENFAETLQHVIETDPDGQHLKNRIKLKFW